MQPGQGHLEAICYLIDAQSRSGLGAWNRGGTSGKSHYPISCDSSTVQEQFFGSLNCQCLSLGSNWSGYIITLNSQRLNYFFIFIFIFYKFIALIT